MSLKLFVSINLVSSILRYCHDIIDIDAQKSAILPILLALVFVYYLVRFKPNIYVPTTYPGKICTDFRHTQAGR